MKFLKYAAVLAIGFSFVGVAQAKGDIFYSAPFHNVEVKAASKIYVRYKFNVHKQTLVCTSDQENNVITSVEWTYKGATRKIELPVTLKDDVRFEGHDIDPDDTLSITNEFGDGGDKSGSIFVSCEFRKMK